jgi:hypothetical protein
MRRWMTVSAFSVAGALFVACSDDEGSATGNGGGGGSAGAGGSAGTAGNAGSGASAGTAGNAGAGGSSGTAGTAGVGGTAGAGGSAGTAGAAGSAGSGNDPDAGDGGVDNGDSGVGDASAAPPCTGCLELRVPFTAPNQAAFFQLVFTTRDLHDTVATFRLRSQILDETGQLFLHGFGTDSAFDEGAGTSSLINAATFGDTQTFVDVPFDLATATPITNPFDNTSVLAVGIQVNSGGAFVGPTTAVLLLDSITFTGTATLTNLDFTTDAQGFTVNVNAGLQTTQVIHH